MRAAGVCLVFQSCSEGSFEQLRAAPANMGVGYVHSYKSKVPITHWQLLIPPFLVYLNMVYAVTLRIKCLSSPILNQEETQSQTANRWLMHIEIIITYNTIFGRESFGGEKR